MLCFKIFSVGPVTNHCLLCQTHTSIYFGFVFFFRIDHLCTLFFFCSLNVPESPSLWIIGSRIPNHTAIIPNQLSGFEFSRFRRRGGGFFKLLNITRRLLKLVNAERVGLFFNPSLPALRGFKTSRVDCFSSSSWRPLIISRLSSVTLLGAWAHFGSCVKDANHEYTHQSVFFLASPQLTDFQCWGHNSQNRTVYFWWPIHATPRSSASEVLSVYPESRFSSALQSLPSPP